jgi:hypothetical protein
MKYKDIILRYRKNQNSKSITEEQGNDFTIA